MPVEATCEEADATCEEAEGVTLDTPVDTPVDGSDWMLLEALGTDDEAVRPVDVSIITGTPVAQLPPRQPASVEEALGLSVFLLQPGQTVLVTTSVVTLPTGQLVTVGAQLVMV